MKIGTKINQFTPIFILIFIFILTFISRRVLDDGRVGIYFVLGYLPLPSDVTGRNEHNVIDQCRIVVGTVSVKRYVQAF